MIPGPIRDFLDKPEFRSGIGAGAGLAVFALALGLVAKERRRATLPIGGVLVAAGFVLGVRDSPRLSPSTGIGLLLLAAAGATASRLRRPAHTVIGAALALPGAIVLATHTRVPPVPEHHHAAWTAPLIVVSIVVGGPLVADFDRRFGVRGWPMVLYAVSAVGVFFTVPDTERALVLLGISLPLLLLGWPFAFASLGPAGSYAAVGVLVWVSATEGRGRHSAIIGGIACLGLFVVEPLARAVRGGRATVFQGLSTAWWMVFPVALVHLALVFVASRIAGLQHSTGIAAAIVGAELVVVTLALARPDPPFGTVFDDSRKARREP